MENKIDIKKLREKVYEISNSKCPLDCFFNDIQQNNDSRYNKVLAYKDLEIVADFIIELQNKDKTPTEEEIIKEWEALGYEFCRIGYEIHIKHIEKDKEFIIYLNIMEYCCSEITSCEICFTTLKEHQLLTKTFKMLDWEV